MTFLQFWTLTIQNMGWFFCPFFIMFTLWGLYEVIENKWNNKPSNIKKRKRRMM